MCENLVLIHLRLAEADMMQLGSWHTSFSPDFPSWLRPSTKDTELLITIQRVGLQTTIGGVNGGQAV
jgi:hypothetical protein